MREELNSVIDKHTMHPGGVEIVYSTLLQLQNDGPQGSDAPFTLCLPTNRLLHRKCDLRIFIHELQNFAKRTSERSERVSFQSFATSE